ncbi:Cell division integral membrane protein, YggT and half-length relatives [hydrothermal vent metagenome]|uniref:Cell division integral membrane protein, YggT and half-length relatives n=1 Tax=hydrothermal vent metagenome TaxID=652676 RepID=A0A3B0WWF3_9ZZZZ
MSQENPFIFLVDTIFSIYIAVMLLRFILQQVGADFYNPISQFIVKATQPLVGIARRYVPSIKKIDTATLALVFALIIIKLIILFSIAGYPMNGQQLAVKGLYDLISLIFDIFIVALFVQAILSWVNPDPYHPVSALLRSLTFPILDPIRKFMPPMGGIDLSTIVGLIGLMFLKRLILSLFQML